MPDYSKMFKAYDIRGTTPALNAAVYYWSGFGLVDVILKPARLPLEVCVMRDCRSTSPEFYAAFWAGIAAAGGQPLALGISTTDLLYAACQVFDLPGGMITASHNPKGDNGLKIVKKVPQMLGLSTGLDLIRDFVLQKLAEQGEEVPIFTQPIENTSRKQIVLDYYRQKIIEIGETAQVSKQLADSGRSFKVVVDTGNGMAGYIMPIIAELYPAIEFIPLYWELDGNFPNHPADPMTPANLVDLQQQVISNQANLGIAFDGDGDRAFFIDERGENINGEHLVALISKFMVAKALKHPELGLNPAVVYVVAYSRSLADTVLQAGGAAVISKQGHTYVKAEMQRYNAIYGGEASGHHYFGSFGYMDSGALIVAVLFKILVESEEPASELCSYYVGKYFLSGEKNYVTPPELDMLAVKQLVKAQYQDAVISELDGITVYYLSWKMTIRGSNTEPLLRINIECRENTLTNNPEARLEAIKSLLKLK